MNYNFPWQRDSQGEYLVFRVTDERTVEMREANTAMFIYAGELAMFNHIWVETEDEPDDENNIMGVRIWQQSLDSVIGAGAFHALCSDLIKKGWAIADEDEPSDLDRQAYYQTFKGLQMYETDEDTIVANAMRLFDKEAEYYLGHEWT
jgi:hypothetical protein